MKNNCIDPEITKEIKEVFETYGKKRITKKGTELITPEIHNSNFFYVESGLLSVNIDSGFFYSSVIIKLIPEKRGYGFTNYFIPSFQRHTLLSLKDTIYYTISYSLVDTLLNNKIINIDRFKQYSYSCIKTTNNCLSSFFSNTTNKILPRKYDYINYENNFIEYNSIYEV